MQSVLSEIRVSGLTRDGGMPDFVQAAQTTLAQAQFAALALIFWGAEFERLEVDKKLI